MRTCVHTIIFHHPFTHQSIHKTVPTLISHPTSLTHSLIYSMSFSQLSRYKPSLPITNISTPLDVVSMRQKTFRYTTHKTRQNDVYKQLFQIVAQGHIPVLNGSLADTQ